MRAREKEYQRRRQTPQDRMLADFLRAETPHEKREVIKTFMPFYYVFGTKLDPNNPYEEKKHEQ